MTPQEAVVTVEQALSATVLLGSTPEKRHRELKILLHPDRFGRDADWVRRAEAAIYRLDGLLSTISPSAPRSVTIGKWVVTGPLAKGDIADLHHAESIDGKGVLKISQSARDNDLMQNERDILKSLHLPNEKEAIHYRKYLPTPIEGISASGRAVNVISMATSYISLKDLCGIFPMDFRHVVWMMNRALSVLGYIHEHGVIHGAITPDHLLYEPATHNLCLVDWCYASSGTPIKAIVKRYRDLYPPEILRKQKPSAATDLYMTASVLRSVAEIPKRFRPLFDLCLAGSPASRPQSAWDFQDKWKAVSEQEYGMPRFVPLVLPVH